MTESRTPEGADRAQAADTARAADLWGAFGATWMHGLDAMAAWSQTWQSILEKRGGPAAALVSGALANPAAWPESVLPIMDEMRRALALPRLADLPSMNAALLPSAGTPVETMLLLLQYLGAAMPVWVKACETFQSEVERRRATGETLDLLADGMDVWNGVLDRTLMAFNRSPEFGDLQKRVLRMAMRQRQDIRRRAELVAEAIDMPTRTEMLDVYERLHGLMREVHALRREVRTLKKAGARGTATDSATSRSGAAAEPGEDALRA